MIPTTAPKPAPVGELGLRSALVAAGPEWGTKTGRGRPTREETERGEYLVTNHNYRIKGMAVSKSTPAVEGKPSPKVTRTPVTGTKVVVDLIPQTRGEDLIPIMPDGKKWPIGIKGSCNVCKVSLTHCPCPTPMVWLDYKTEGTVTFRAKISK